MVLQHICNHLTWIYSLPGKWLKKQLNVLLQSILKIYLKKQNDFQNKSLEDLKVSENLIIEFELPQPRIRSKKKMPGELCRDETPLNIKDKFWVEIFRCIIDQLVNGFTERFSDNIIIITDMQYLLPVSPNILRMLKIYQILH